ncbi:hypothetical protein [Pseudoalteromonas sp. TB64]|uniref:hypothetical protein n=1 Tax=Pseudoalteromonas sp. TB64 TaxID=1938600 RepID=UPI00040C35B4|nr:hypothetical protein [Pseudoalteromonas sp. TB64]
MTTLKRYKKLPTFKLFYNLAWTTLVVVIFLFWMEFLTKEPIYKQFLILFGGGLLSVIGNWFSANKKQSKAIEIIDGQFEILGIKIKISDLQEVLYCQTKRFEHSLRFKFTNATYQDIEISAPDLIDDLRFYYFMVDNGLPVKMTDDRERFFSES